MVINNADIDNEIALSNVVTLRSNQKGIERVFQREFSFAETNIRPGGLLDEVLSSLPSPLDSSYYALFCQALKTLQGAKKAERILSLPSSRLETVDIITLYTIIEEKIHSELVVPGRYQSGARPSMLFRKVMSYLTTPLKDGARIEDVSFTSIFKEAGGRRDLISDSVDPGTEDPEISAPVTMIQAGSAEELNGKALNHLKARTARIKDSAESIISDFLSVRRQLYALKCKTLSADLTDVLEDHGLSSKETLDTLQELQSEDLLHFYLHFFSKHNLADLGKIEDWLERYGSFPGIEVVAEHPFIETLGLKATNKLRRNAASILLILSQYFLPALVVLSCRHLFQIQFKWNIGTCNSVTTSSITSTPDGYSICSIKPKTSQYQATNLSQELVGTEFLREVVPMLVAHSKWLSSNWKRKSDSVFISIIFPATGIKLPHANHVPYERYNSIFCERYSLPRFTSEQLRDQSLNQFYMETRDIHALKAIAGWDSIDTAQSYLGQRIIRVLSEVNISNFMKTLEGSIVWATKGEDYLHRLGIDPEEVDRKLLFPINTESVGSSSSAIDEWLENQSTQIVLSTDRIKHTYRQANWYRSNWQALLSTNEQRFIDLHLPRILTCLAVEKMIKSSEHSHLYQDVKVTDE